MDHVYQAHPEKERERVCVCVYVCMYVCVKREREVGEREDKGHSCNFRTYKHTGLPRKPLGPEKPESP